MSNFASLESLGYRYEWKIHSIWHKSITIILGYQLNNKLTTINLRVPLKKSTVSVHSYINKAYRIYSLIRRTIFYKKICLFDQNLLKTRGESYNRVFSRNKI